MADRALEHAEWAGVGQLFAGLPGARERLLEGCVVRWRPDRPDHPWQSQVMVDAAVPEQVLDEALALAGPAAFVQVPDHVLDPELLRHRGFEPGPPLRRLVAAAAAPPPQTPLCLVVAGPREADAVVAVATAGFGEDEPDWWAAALGRPGWTQLLALDGEVPVATAALHVAGAVAWIGATTTVPAARGRGAQTALLRERLRLARSAGAERVVAKADAGSSSERNLLRAGFTPAYDVLHWRRPAG